MHCSHVVVSLEARDPVGHGRNERTRVHVRVRSVAVGRVRVFILL